MQDGYEDATLVILSPRPWQVIQRHAPDAGHVLISGVLREATDTIELRFLRADLSPVADMITAQPHPQTGQFQVWTTLPAGGWYRLEATAVGTAEPAAIVEKFGIGEVFVMGGQSNSTNSGEFKTEPETGMVSSFSGMHWQPADDPQPGVLDDSPGGSPWPTFGDEMYRRLNVPIGIASTGFGGSSVLQWTEDGALYKWTMTRVHQLGPGGFRALLWHQGESDYMMSEEEYFERMKHLIVASRLQAGWEIPWVTAQASYHSEANPMWHNVRAAQQRLWDEKVSIQGPDTDTLTGANRDSTLIHFSPQGLRAHGMMWADHVTAWMEAEGDWVLGAKMKYE